MTNTGNTRATNHNIGSRKGVPSKDAGRHESAEDHDPKESAQVESSYLTPRDSHVPRNVMSSRHKKTDDLIEQLQRSLFEQMSLSQQEEGKPVLHSALSGAVAPRVGPRQGQVREGKRPTSRKRGSKSSQVAHIISKTQELVSLGEALGIDMSKPVKNISHAKAALGRREPAVARDWAARANNYARDEISLRCPAIIRKTSTSLKELENVSGVRADLRNLVARARIAHKDQEYKEALRALRTAKGKIGKAQSELLLRIIAESKSEFVRAKKAGLKIDDAVALLGKSRDLLRRGEFAKAVKCAHESKRVLDKMFLSQREARNPLVECVKAVSLAETLGADVQGLNELMAEAKRLFKQNDLQRSAERSRRLLDLAKRTGYGRAAEAYESAEKALALAKKMAVETPGAEERLARAKELLESDQLALSVSEACASILESDSAIVDSLAERLKSIDEFAKGIEQDVDSLTEVQEGIESSKRRNIENMKKYANLTENIIGEAYECAASYARVAQDIVKQAYETSVEASPLKEFGGKSVDGLELQSDGPSAEECPADAKRRRLVNMFMTGKVSETQLDRLLLVLDSSVDKDNLV